MNSYSCQKLFILCCLVIQGILIGCNSVSAQLKVDAGNDTTYCAGFWPDTMYLGENLIIENGTVPFSYRWECRFELTPALIISASDFLNDTTSANPYFTDWLTLPDRIRFTVQVTDAENNTAKDSITVGFSGCACYTGYQVIHLNKGDSVWLDAGIPSGNIEKIYWEPAYGLSNPDSSATWCKPDSTMNYSIVSVDRFGCVCSCHAYEIRVNEDTNSQHDYRELVQGGKLWSTTETGTENINNYRSYWIKFQGDTLINDLEYKKVLQVDDSLYSDWYVNGFIREDAATQKVYLYDSYSNEDMLLYDFSLEQGDSILTGNGESYAKVDTIIYEPFGNSTDTLKQIYFAWGGRWIEGIGSLWGVLEGLNAFYMTGAITKLVCYFENDILVYHNPDFETCFPDSTTVSVSMFGNKKDIEVFPNPASDKITINTPGSRIFEVEIYDLTGTCLYRKLNIETNRIDLNTDNLPKGLYILKIRDERDTISRKIVIQ